MNEVKSDGKQIQNVSCYQMTTETTFELEANVFVDATGNGTLGYYAGAEYKIGREGCLNTTKKMRRKWPMGKRWAIPSILWPKTLGIRLNL
ncbi:MAG: FAD-dependent oxidoreductase [Oscillospiraceae bacterium]